MTRRAKLVLGIWLLAVGGLVLHAHEVSSPPTDNVTHQSAVCQHFYWDASTARYVTVNYSPPGGGGCK